jgi:hypothetical protein
MPELPTIVNNFGLRGDGKAINGVLDSFPSGRTKVKTN